MGDGDVTAVGVSTSAALLFLDFVLSLNILADDTRDVVDEAGEVSFSVLLAGGTALRMVPLTAPSTMFS